MHRELEGQKCYFNVSEPLDYGFEKNPDPLPLEMIGSSTVQGRKQIVLKGIIRSKGNIYCIGLASARYIDDDVISLIEQSRECIVNAMFFREQQIENQPSKMTIDELITACSVIPLSERLLLIGDIRLA